MTITVVSWALKLGLMFAVTVPVLVELPVPLGDVIAGGATS